MINRSIFNKIFVGFCLTFLIATLIGSIVCFADNATQLLSGAAMIDENGYIHIVSATSRYIYYINLDETKSGTITLSFSNNINGNILFSSDDDPSDLAVGYTFISTDFTTLSGPSPITVSFSNVKYAYITTNRTFQYEITYSGDPTPSTSPSPTPTDNPTPTGTVSPTPVPTGKPEQSGIYFRFDVPLDYYFIIIIILMGGLLICQLFKN